MKRLIIKETRDWCLIKLPSMYYGKREKMYVSVTVEPATRETVESDIDEYIILKTRVHYR